MKSIDQPTDHDAINAVMAQITSCDFTPSAAWVVTYDHRAWMRMFQYKNIMRRLRRNYKPQKHINVITTQMQ